MCPFRPGKPKIIEDLWKDDFSMKSKDKEVEAIYIKNLENKLYFEYTTSTTNMALTQNVNCYKEYKKFLCRWNFPFCTGKLRCMPQTKKSQWLMYDKRKSALSELCLSAKLYVPHT